MTVPPLELRKVLVLVEETLIEGRVPVAGAPLRKAAAAAIVRNPYAGRPFSVALDELVEPSAALGTLLGERLGAALGVPVQSYGKAALVGMAGEQEHAVATVTSVFGDAFRAAVGGGTAWLPSVSKRCVAGTPVDVPLCFKDEIWVRSHYDAITVAVPDAPGPDEVVVVVGVASGGRVHERLGGMTVAQAAKSSPGDSDSERDLAQGLVRAAEEDPA